MPLKLTVELIPETTWYKNLRNHVSKETWDRIRKDCYKKADYRCEICRAGGKIHCHEVWEFERLKNIQKLRGFITFCKLCHDIKHIGFVNVKISRGEISQNYFETLANHFMKVNGVSRKEFDDHCGEAYSLWEERSKKKWKLDFGTFLAAYKHGQRKLF